MNKKRRATIKMAEKYLDMAADLIVDAKCEEQDSIDNMPENLQSSDRYIEMEDVVDSLEDAINSIDEAKDYISKAIA